MGLNDTPKAERLHIGIFGRRNAGKSSIINAITGQNLAIVSDVKGTTTDPVQKAMELLPLGPVVLIDTPGTDDVGELGQKRVEKAVQMLNKTDIAVLVADGTLGITPEDTALIAQFKDRHLPYVIVLNKADAVEEKYTVENGMWVSAVTGEGITELKEYIAHLVPTGSQNRIIGDRLSTGDVVVLVVPIDSAAPKGRLILPQQQTIRDILEAGALAVVVRDTELELTLRNITPKLVITDSQVFGKVKDIVPPNIPLTSFSILMARYKGNLNQNIAAVRAVNALKDGDDVLISEGCTHHRQCEDIGTVKIPHWLEEFTGVKPNYHFSSGTEFPTDLSKYKVVIHCGGCTLNEKEMQHRLKTALEQGVPMTNYGILISHINGILKRSLEFFPEYEI